MASAIVKNTAVASSNLRPELKEVAKHHKLHRVKDLDTLEAIDQVIDPFHCDLNKLFPDDKQQTGRRAIVRTTHDFLMGTGTGGIGFVTWRAYRATNKWEGNVSGTAKLTSMCSYTDDANGWGVANVLSTGSTIANVSEGVGHSGWAEFSANTQTPGGEANGYLSRTIASGVELTNLTPVQDCGGYIAQIPNPNLQDLDGANIGSLLGRPDTPKDVIRPGATYRYIHQPATDAEFEWSESLAGWHTSPYSGYTSSSNVTDCVIVHAPSAKKQLFQGRCVQIYEVVMGQLDGVVNGAQSNIAPKKPSLGDPRAARLAVQHLRTLQHEHANHKDPSTKAVKKQVVAHAMQGEIQEAKEDLAMHDATNIARDAVKTGKAVYRGYKDVKKAGTDLYKWVRSPVNPSKKRKVASRLKHIRTHGNMLFRRRLNARRARRY